MSPWPARTASSRSCMSCSRNPGVTLTQMSNDPQFQQIVDAVRQRHRFVVSSHARPDGDSIGSQLAFAYAARALGKEVTVVNRDLAPPPLMAFPGVPTIRIADSISGDFDAAVIMECGDVARPGVAGLD